MVAVPIPLPPPPVTRPGWDPTQVDPYGGPTVGQVWSKMKEAAGVGVDAKAEPRAQARDTDCSQTSNQNQCNQCKLAQGVLTPANYTIPAKQYDDFDYQLRIANMHAAPEFFDYTYGGTKIDRARAKLLGGKNEITVTEWLYGTIRFDGFWRPSCKAVEAKANYQQFLTAEGRPQPWLRRPTVFESWFKQAAAQLAQISALGPPAKLEWHFLQLSCYRAAQGIFGPYRTVCRYTP
ncbi:restriction endonuclease fold toxin 5 domain-containing protein [Xanthomonas translucens]|uniref:restriction endonuclease fold toxin 5 domain-containing protein n=2 Tax=Xanthomonas campestris pv. translucens TaxID=343 RepID=UPI0021B81116|nr:restriction endonuclease fold toxin 5 domain-containing protein [Xanthomonas translucens]